MREGVSLLQFQAYDEYLPRPVPAVLAVNRPLRPGALPAHLLVVGVAHVPLLVVEVDKHLLGPPLDHILQAATCNRPAAKMILFLPLFYGISAPPRPNLHAPSGEEEH